MMDSPTAVREAIAALLGPALTIPFYPYEPLTAPTQDFATLFFDGYGPVDWDITVRIYVPYGAIGAEAAQQKLETLMPEVEAALTSQYGPVQWTVVPDLENGVLVASWPTRVGREDF